MQDRDRKLRDAGKPYGMYSRMIMPHGCLYLNNAGHRWVCRDMRFVLVLPDGTRTVRLAHCYESFGNFAAIVYRYQGKTYRGLPKSNEGYETRSEGATGNDALPHVFHKE